MKRCPNCGEENDDNNKFCARCGNILVSGAIDRKLSDKGIAYSTRDHFEVKPKTKRNAIIFASCCLSFIVAGLWAISAATQPEEYFCGLLSVVLGGGFGIYCLPKLFRRKISMVLTPYGIKQITHFGSATIPWNDIEKVGVWSSEEGVMSTFAIKSVGLQLKNYSNYLEGMSPELEGWLIKSLPYERLFTSILLKVGVNDPSESLESFGKVRSIAEMFLWSRKTYGYDILIGWADLDRSAKDFANLLEQYRKNAKT